MKRAISLGVIFCFGSIAACGDDGSGGSGGAGGSANTGGDAGGPPHMMVAACDEIGVCTPPSNAMGIDPYRSCLECAVAGDTTVAPDGGSCEAAFVACFGTQGDCVGGEPDCCAFYDCASFCDSNANGRLDESELGCFCTTEDDGMGGVQCSSTSMAGTCVGDHGVGLGKAIDYEDCVYGLTSPGVCAASCM
ncbi:MAG: hypothetical protein U0271_42285 [Polyangiaceae bacterium]